jgi:hypothetical protein
MTHYTTSQLHFLIERFEKRQLPKVEWTHEAHLAVAIWYLTHYTFDEALALVRKNITDHNTSVGTPNSRNEGYHETITRFWLSTAKHFLAERQLLTVTENVNAFITSDKGQSSYPLHYYNSSTLFSVYARQHWVEPDLQHLP